MKRALFPCALGIITTALVFGGQTQPSTAPASMAGTVPAAASQAVTVNAAIPADLAKTITSALSLAESKSYKELIETLAPPDAIAEMKAAGKFDEVVASFGERAKDLITALHQVAGLAPTLTDEGKTATFTLPGDGPHSEMKFTKNADKWVLQ